MDTVCCPAPLSGGIRLEGWVRRLLRRVRGAWLAVLFALDAAGERRNAAYEGENAARVLDSYGNAILRLAYTYMHSMSDAENILQETLIRYLTKAPRAGKRRSGDGAPAHCALSCTQCENTALSCRVRRAHHIRYSIRVGLPSGDGYCAGGERGCAVRSLRRIWY